MQKSGGTNLTGVVSVSIGLFHACAATNDGAAWCWGLNSRGELGDGTTTQRKRAVRVTKEGGGDLTGVVAVGAGGSTSVTFPENHTHNSCAVTDDGAAWCWGGNGRGQLGDGTDTDRARAVRVTKTGGGDLTGVETISAGRIAACASLDDGTAWCWGDNRDGQLGDGTETDRDRAIQVTKSGGGDLTSVRSVSAGGLSSCAATTSGGAWCWGNNEAGGLGDGTKTDRSRAVQVIKKSGGVLTGVTSVRAHSNTYQGGTMNHACARTSDGSAWCWGFQFTGLSTKSRPRAVAVLKANGDRLAGARSVSTSSTHSCARTKGAAWCWGSNTWRQLGDGTNTPRARAVKVIVL